MKRFPCVLVLTLFILMIVSSAACADLQRASSSGENDPGSQNMSENLPADDSSSYTEQEGGTGFEYLLVSQPRQTEGVERYFGGSSEYHAIHGGWTSDLPGIQVYHLSPYDYSFRESAQLKMNPFDFQPGRLDAFFDVGTDLPCADYSQARDVCDQIAAFLEFKTETGRLYSLTSRYVEAGHTKWPSPSGIDRLLSENPRMTIADITNTADEFRRWEEEDVGFLAIYPVDNPLPGTIPVLFDSEISCLTILWHPRYGVVYLSCPPAYHIQSIKEAPLVSDDTAVYPLIPDVLNSNSVPLDYADIESVQLTYTFTSAYDELENMVYVIRPCWQIFFLPAVDDWELWHWLKDADVHLDYTKPLYVKLDAFTADPGYYWNTRLLP